MLPWAEQKVASQQVASQQTAQKVQQSFAASSVSSSGFNPAAPAKKGSISNPLDSIDIGATIVAGFLALGVFVVSLSCPIVGIGLYRYFSNEDNWLRYAAGAGLGIVLLAFMARFLLIGSAVNHTVNPTTR